MNNQEDVVIAGCDAYCLDVKCGFIVASPGYMDTKVMDETSKTYTLPHVPKTYVVRILIMILQTKRILFEGRPGTSQLNGCTLCKTEQHTLLVLCKNSCLLQGLRCLPPWASLSALSFITPNACSLAIARDGISTRAGRSS